jgi:phenylalanyl-tRNA synthetase beta chain
MRVPLSWLAEHVDLPADVTARDLEAALVRVGLEVEAVDEIGAGLAGPLVVGRVLEYVEEPQTNGKTIRWCSVDVGNPEPQGVVCGARNFAVGDLVVVVLPGAVLPGGFAISARTTYGHVSAGMICSVRELGLGDEHDGILVLTEADVAGAVPGDDARGVLGLPDAVLDIAVTPDRGYCLSVRGVAREVATAFGTQLRDPALRPTPAGNAQGWAVVVEDTSGCDRFVTRTVRGIDPTATSPFWLRRRLSLAGMRPISFAVDVTNYVMLELGQPTHGYDRDRLQGAIVVRRARSGESLKTLDGTARPLTGADLLITDSSGPIGIAGVMGGESTELSEATRDVVVEAAHFDPMTIGKAARRHRLPSEASRRFERDVDDSLAPAAADRVVELLVTLGGGTADPGVTDVDLRVPRVPLPFTLDVPERMVGYAYTAEQVTGYLEAVGCSVSTVGEAGAGSRDVLVTPPSWRPDLLVAADLVEEVARLHGYDTIPSRLPPVAPGGGYTARQRRLVRVQRAVASAGLVEVATYPFVGPSVLDALDLGPDDERRRALRLANPLSDEEPFLRTTLLPGLAAAARRNLGRGFADLALFETGRVFLPGPGSAPAAPRLGVDRRPTEAEIAGLDATLPDQPVHLGALLIGAAELTGWWGAGRLATWADAVELARTAVGALHANAGVRAAQRAPWHPGRCAEVFLDLTEGEQVLGHAGELHPRVCLQLGLPPRTCALELSLQPLLEIDEPLQLAPTISGYPVATQDVALVVAADVPAAAVERALVSGAGPLLESVRLFDLYTGGQVGEGSKSLAFTLRFRAFDRTLTADEASAARDAAVAEAARQVGATLRR